VPVDGSGPPHQALLGISTAGGANGSYNGRMHDRTLGRAAFLGIGGAGIAGLFLGRDVTGLLGRLTPDTVEAVVPTSGWRIYTIGSSIPRIDPAAYRLAITGAVERPVTYTLADLRDLPRAEQVSDFHCVTGWSVSDVHWAGVRFRDLLDAARLRPDAKALRFVSDEVPYDDTLRLPQALLPDVLLALDMDVGPLSAPHGAPARVVMPRMYGYKSVKWVTGIEVQTHTDHVGYWEQRGYDEDAWIGDSNGL
jgi:DMSO/TMAO reductase YedYZ molybdopterin-dependent catalytic subunit